MKESLNLSLTRSSNSPFKMPMADYNIGRYILNLLKQIDFEDFEDEKLDPSLRPNLLT